MNYGRRYYALERYFSEARRLNKSPHKTIGHQIKDIGCHYYKVLDLEEGLALTMDIHAIVHACLKPWRHYADKEQKIQELASAYPIEFDKLINAIDDLELAKRRKNQFDKIIQEMFSE